jgi:hypothetical protein
MVNENAFLIKPKISKLRLFGIYASGNLNLLDVNHQIYVPEWFVLGQFKQRGDVFKLNQDKIFYRDYFESNTTLEFLKKYQNYIDDGRLEIVKAWSLSRPILESIVQKGKMYNDSKREIGESLPTINQDLILSI